MNSPIASVTITFYFINPTCGKISAKAAQLYFRLRRKDPGLRRLAKTKPSQIGKIAAKPKFGIRRYEQSKGLSGDRFACALTG